MAGGDSGVVVLCVMLSVVIVNLVNQIGGFSSVGFLLLRRKDHLYFLIVIYLYIWGVYFLFYTTGIIFFCIFFLSPKSTSL